MVKIVPLDAWSYLTFGKFYETIKDNKYFHPHPFTFLYAIERCFNPDDDFYYIFTDDAEDKVLAYGILRGIGKWETPCLGIYVVEDYRRKGVGETLVRFLHLAAKLKGIKRLRLHVAPENERAMALYKKFGYEFVDKRDNGELIGYKGL